MSMLIYLIIIVTIFDAVLMTFNKISNKNRRKKTKKHFDKNKITAKLLNKIKEQSELIKSFKKKNINSEEYDILKRKYELLLNQFRILTQKNKFLDKRIKVLKEKLY